MRWRGLVALAGAVLAWACDGEQGPLTMDSGVDLAPGVDSVAADTAPRPDLVPPTGSYGQRCIAGKPGSCAPSLDQGPALSIGGRLDLDLPLAGVVLER